MSEKQTPYIVTSNDDNTIRANLSSAADAITGTLDVLFAELDALQAEVAELRRTPARQGWRDRREAAEYLRCHPSTIDDMAASGRLPKHLLGTKPLFKVEDLDALLTPVVLDDEADAA